MLKAQEKALFKVLSVLNNKLLIPSTERQQLNSQLYSIISLTHVRRMSRKKEEAKKKKKKKVEFQRFIILF